MFQLERNAGRSGVHEACRGELSGVGTSRPALKFTDKHGEDLSGRCDVTAATTAEAISTVEKAIAAAELPQADAAGYRVVHPGAKLKGHQRITDEVLQALHQAAAFAPLHDPVAIEMIEETRRLLPEAAHFACFDTVFHETMPEAAATYAIPQEFRDRGVRRYGFHGLSCESVVMQLREARMALPEKMVIAHLGSGCSVTAVVQGRSVDTTMGLTPTGGVVMGTRPGDLDPGLMIYLLRQMDGDAAKELETMVNHKAGMVALSGMSNDMKAMRKAAEGRDAGATLAVEVFTRSVRKAIGGFAFLMGGLDAVVFTGGIGEHDAATRAEALAGLGPMGIAMDESLNGAETGGLRVVSASGPGTTVYVVPAKEELMIARHVGAMMG